jgi:hypothetical protein
LDRAPSLRLLQDPKWSKRFDSGFHCDRAGTVALAMLAVFLEAKIALAFVQPDASANKVIRSNKYKESEASQCRQKRVNA